MKRVLSLSRLYAFHSIRLIGDQIRLFLINPNECIDPMWRDRTGGTVRFKNLWECRPGQACFRIKPATASNWICTPARPRGRQTRTMVLSGGCCTFSNLSCSTAVSCGGACHRTWSASERALRSQMWNACFQTVPNNGTPHSNLCRQMHQMVAWYFLGKIGSFGSFWPALNETQKRNLPKRPKRIRGIGLARFPRSPQKGVHAFSGGKTKKNIR